MFNSVRDTASGINNVYQNALDTPGPSQQGALLSGIVSVENQPQADLFTRQPTEILHKIAFSLNAEDYGNLRATCKDFAERLPGFSAISEALKQGSVQGETAERYRDMAMDKQIRSIFRNDSKVASAIRNCRSELENPGYELTLAGTHSTSGYRNGMDHIYNMIRLCIVDMADSGVPASVNLFRWSGSSQQKFVLDMLFENIKIDQEALNAIFNSFDKTYHDTDGPQRFVMARIADTLRNYWTENPPGSVNRDNITALPAAYPELFKAANNVAAVMNHSAERA